MIAFALALLEGQMRSLRAIAIAAAVVVWAVDVALPASAGPFTFTTISDPNAITDPNADVNGRNASGRNFRWR